VIERESHHGHEQLRAKQPPVANTFDGDFISLQFPGGRSAETQSRRVLGWPAK
jgi:hypothetical protein